MFELKRNMGVVDRSARILVGSSLWLVGPATDILQTDLMSNVILGVLGSMAILSAVFAYCFLYDVTGFHTSK